MSLNKGTSYTLLHVLNGCSTAAEVSHLLKDVDIRSVQRAILRLTEIEVLEKEGANNNPTYKINYPTLLQLPIADKLLEDENRPTSTLHRNFVNWLVSQSAEQLDKILNINTPVISVSEGQITPKALEHLTIELSWKSSALEGNTYTLLDTQLLLIEGVKAKNKTDFETQMILNHKDAISFIIENRELFINDIAYSSVEELHRIIGKNLGIETGLRKKNVKISASNYEPSSNPHQLKEVMLDILTIINCSKQPYVKGLLALALIPYLQAFEDGNKRTGRMLANAILICTINKGFSLRETDAKQLALAYLSFYEFNSIRALSRILKTELS